MGSNGIYVYIKFQSLSCILKNKNSNQKCYFNTKMLFIVITLNAIIRHPLLGCNNLIKHTNIDCEDL